MHRSFLKMLKWMIHIAKLFKIIISGEISNQSHTEALFHTRMEIIKGGLLIGFYQLGN